MSTVPEALGVLRRSAAARPLLTYYDQGTGERTELSGATFDNWVAKTASYLTEELDLERGESLGVDLPCHWMSAIFAAAAWSLGVVVEAESHAQERAAARDAARVVVCGPDTLNDHQATGGRHVVACALHPLATRFATPLPAGVRDFGVEVWGQPDAFTPWDPPEP
ncbi:MAG: TIGR03089 family protein, partial [Nocardioides sp.]